MNEEKENFSLGCKFIVSIFWGIIFVLIVFSVLSELSLIGKNHERLVLGNELGVDYRDYPLEIYFPWKYYEEILAPGMKKSEVHQLIKGYEVLYDCGSTSEIYYFYSDDDTKALRIEILYDENNEFKEIWAEDLNSETYKVDNCIRVNAKDE